MSEANWPIRVGGEYRIKNSNYPGHNRRVTAIDGDRVFSDNFFADDPRKIFSSGNISSSVFRSLSLPEDQSPIPELVAALELLLDHCLSHIHNFEDWPDCTTVRAALAKAHSTAVSVSPQAEMREEVAR